MKRLQNRPAVWNRLILNLTSTAMTLGWTTDRRYRSSLHSGSRVTSMVLCRVYPLFIVVYIPCYHAPMSRHYISFEDWPQHQFLFAVTHEKNIGMSTCLGDRTFSATVELHQSQVGLCRSTLFITLYFNDMGLMLTTYRVEMYIPCPLKCRTRKNPVHFNESSRIREGCTVHRDRIAQPRSFSLLVMTQASNSSE